MAQVDDTTDDTDEAGDDLPAVALPAALVAAMELDEDTPPAE